MPSVRRLPPFVIKSTPLTKNPVGGKHSRAASPNWGRSNQKYNRSSNGCGTMREKHYGGALTKGLRCPLVAAANFFRPSARRVWEQREVWPGLAGSDRLDHRLTLG